MHGPLSSRPRWPRNRGHTTGRYNGALPVRPRFLKPVLAGVVVGILLTSFALFFYLRAITRPAPGTPTLDPPLVVQQIQQLSELVSVKYTVQKTIGLEEKKVPFGAEKILLFVQAEVLAGVDLASLEATDVSVLEGGKVVVHLPAARILHVVIDDKQTKVWDRQITWWTPWVPPNPDLERRARLAARESIEAAAREMGILDEAQKNAESVIRGLLTALGADSVTFVSAS